MTLLLPVRLDLIGGWSDQPDFPHPGAVFNGAFGWGGKYPLRFDEYGALRSEVQGIGTGLGISSIVAAGRCMREAGLTRRPTYDEYTAHVLQWEAEYGAMGGWQDAAGAIEPGLKLIESDDHATLRITRRDDHPILQHLVLFDTGIRREAKPLGDKVRRLMASDGLFNESLRIITQRARIAFHETDASRCAQECLGAWRVLCRYVPEMNVPVSLPFEALGYKLLGAGGGGYGIAFAARPEGRQAILDHLRGNGLWAVVPELLDGARWLGTEPHPCPFLEEIRGDTETLCACDEWDARQCAKDV
jgi:galactokinase/mevalonate kinase-like predicted kinase